MKPDGLENQLLEESLEELYEHAPCGYVSTLPNGTFARVNQTFLDWVGYERGALLGARRFQDLLSIAGRVFYETHAAPLLRMQGFVNELAFDLVCRDGRRLPALVNIVERRDGAGAPYLDRITIFNASDRRAYERELLAARRRAERAAERIARLQAATTALAEALTSPRVAEILVEHGRAALDAQAGLVALEADGGLEIVHAAGYPDHLIERLRRLPRDSGLPLAVAAQTGQPILVESADALRARFPELGADDAGPGHRSLAALALLVDGRAVDALGLSFAAERRLSDEDLAFLQTLARQGAQALERARLYEAERAARAEAQEAVQLRDLFFAVASHELKTPITSLLGHAQLLQRRLGPAQPVTERDQRALQVIVEQAARLSRMVTEMLDAGQIAAGRLSVERAPLDLGALARRVVAEIQPTLTRHSLCYDAPDEALMVNGDELRLEQVLYNLVQNAVKYSPAGGQVQVRLERRGERACLAVADQGIGIPQQALGSLFQRYYRADNVEERGIGGLGIGLYVVKEIVSLHDGEIEVASSEGEGSTFTIYLPLSTRQVAGAALPPLREEAAGG